MAIVKDISGKFRSGRDTYTYAADAKHAGEKVVMAGTVNALANDPDEAAKEIFDLEDLYGKTDGATAHLMYSWHKDDPMPTQEQAQDVAQQIMNDLGYNSPATWHMHIDENGPHIHIVASRVNPEPDEKGQYRLQLHGGTQKWEDGQTNRQECLHHSMATLCERHNWKTLDKMIFTPDGVKIEHPAEDKIKLPQGICAWEAHNGQKHPKRLLAEAYIERFRKSNSRDEFFKSLSDEGMSFRITDRVNEKTGKVQFGGVVKGPRGEKIRLSSLPRDCSIKSWFEKFGETEAGDKTTPAKGSGKGFYKDQMTLNGVKSFSRKAFNASSSMEEAEAKLAEKGVTIERYGKSGAYLCYGDTVKMKLSALGGKYSLSALNKKYNGNSSAYASTFAKSQSKVNALSAKSAWKDATAKSADKAATRAAEAGSDLAGAKSLIEALNEADAAIQAAHQLRKANARAAEAEAALKKISTNAAGAGAAQPVTTENSNMFGNTGMGFFKRRKPKTQEAEAQKPETKITNADAAAASELGKRLAAAGRCGPVLDPADLEAVRAENPEMPWQEVVETASARPASIAEAEMVFSSRGIDEDLADAVRLQLSGVHKLFPTSEDVEEARETLSAAEKHLATLAEAAKAPEQRTDAEEKALWEADQAVEDARTRFEHLERLAPGRIATPEEEAGFEAHQAENAHVVEAFDRHVLRDEATIAKHDALLAQEALHGAQADAYAAAAIALEAEGEAAHLTHEAAKADKAAKTAEMQIDADHQGISATIGNLTADAAKAEATDAAKTAQSAEDAAFEAELAAELASLQAHAATVEGGNGISSSIGDDDSGSAPSAAPRM